MIISSRYHWLLIYDVKRTTKIDGMGPFKYSNGNKYVVIHSPISLKAKVSFCYKLVTDDIRNS